MGKKDGKPRGRMTSYAFFIQSSREEQRKRNPDERVIFAEFSKLCAEKWKCMTSQQKERFNDMAAKDKLRYEEEMSNYPSEKGEKRKKDPNAPKRSLSAFFFFNKEERDKIKESSPQLSLGEMAKELGRRWQKCTNKGKFEALAKTDKVRYENEMTVYNSGAKKAKTSNKTKPTAPTTDDDENGEDAESEHEEEDNEEGEDEDTDEGEADDEDDE
jgi:hypothetical protein